jgi:putative intracellular protease/amidase
MSGQLQGKRIAILVANEGVEQVELTSPLGALRNAGAEWVDEEVHVDQGLVSSRRPGDLPRLAPRRE